MNFCVGDFITSSMRARVFVAKGLLVFLLHCMQLNQYANKVDKVEPTAVFQMNGKTTTSLDRRDSRYESFLSYCPLSCSIGTNRIQDERKKLHNAKVETRLKQPILDY